MEYIDFTEVKTVPTLLLSFMLWFIALIYSIIIMSLLGIDTQDPDVDFGINHDRYWDFELIMTPSYIIFGLLVLVLFYRRFHPLETERWLTQTISSGIIIMISQFILDLLVIVLFFGNGLDYFIGLVTISYVLIPFWCVVSGYIVLNYMKGKEE